MKEPPEPVGSGDSDVLRHHMAVPVGFVPGVETPLDALRLTAPPWAHPGRFANTYQSTN
jgi:hypothetical protein